jgi:hypothetical protein
MQPKCKHDDAKYCIREICVGPCTTVEEIEISEKEFNRIIAYIDPKNKTAN